ncbi:MAG: sigma 54-interacting transcriptional regulator [Candidatus Aminicenantes bacterium]|nr:sigma 54-interacting transcriptional regulator [Candidatus Aminicenantes bacterium]
MHVSELLRRFSDRDNYTFDHWQNEKLNRITVANTRDNLLKIKKIFNFHSNHMQNIIDFRENNFEINIITQPFLANNDNAIGKQNEVQVKSLFRQYLDFLHAAQEWDMDFIDFNKFQILPGTILRFGWNLTMEKFPDAAAFIPLFKKNPYLRFLNKSNYHDFQKNQNQQTTHPTPPGYLFRNDDFASNMLHSHSMIGIKSSANLKIKINTKMPLQAKIIQNTLFHNLDSEEILFIRIAADKISMNDFFADFCNDRISAKKNTTSLVREFSLYLKQSAFQKVIMVIDGLEGKADGQFLRFLLESGDITDLTIILLNDALHFDCDLELNENPSNPLQKKIAPIPPTQKQSKLKKQEIELLKIFRIIEAPVPTAVAYILDSPGSAVRIKALLKKKYIRENRNFFSLCVPGNIPVVSTAEKKLLLALMASRTDWPYITISHCIASENLPALERYLEIHAKQGSGEIASSPTCDLIIRHLPQLASDQRIIIHFLEILIRNNSLNLAEWVLHDHADPRAVLTRLKSAHVALRRKEYQKLGQLLAGLRQVPEAYVDEWLYLNFVSLEKFSESKKADAFAKKIKDPYFHSLAMIQFSDRNIYNGNFAKARSQLDSSLSYFHTQGCCREEIEIQNQLAKLQREKGSFSAAESMYKTIFIRSETEGFRLNSAFTAVDLGNLYLENDDDFQAESWYQKALKLFEKEKNNDGIMLVHSNLITIFIHEGKWKEAENLLHHVLSRSEEKKLPVSCAIDYLNWAYLAYLRLDNDHALKLIGQATKIFQKIGNNKGLAECIFLKCNIFFLDSRTLDTQTPGINHLNADQNIFWNICQLRDHNLDPGQESAMLKQLAAMQSKKTKFAAMAVLLKKFQRAEWLDTFKTISQELSGKSKNYFYYEYWYLYFLLADENEHMDRMTKENFLAMYDFFSLNKRKISEKIDHWRAHLDDSKNHGCLFDDARLVENHRQWRLPEDFFNSFSYEINKKLKVDWLAMHVYEKERLLFKFSNSNLFKELAEEMIGYLHRNPENQNFHLAEIKSKFNSQEKYFFPFASIKMIPWPLSETLRASMVIAFKDKESYFQNFFERNKDILNKFAILFQNYFTNEYQIHEKLDFIIGNSLKISEMKRQIAQISKVDFSLLITGESGSGKELVARAVHQLSPRVSQPFISVNAAALPETLLEAELFGFKKGAFSGAGENRVGLLEAADRGTFFLDEIADLPMNLQAKMLRVLQEKEIRRLGENKNIQIDVRLISACNKNLEELIMAGQFREDLFYRLQDLTIQIPPLRERREDIPLLVAYFLNKFGYQKIDPLKLQDIVDMFQNDCFPGNVRELESKIKKLITFNPDLEHLPGTEKKKFSLKNARQNFECSLLLNTLNETRWNKNKTAEKLGISRMVLFNMLKKHHINK